MPKNEPEGFVVPETEWDKTPMAYQEMQATDEDGNPIEDSGGKSAAGKRGQSAEKEN